MNSPGSNLSGAPGIDLTLDKLLNIINGLACWLTDFALILIVVAIVFFGVKFLISQGDPGKIGDARKGLTWAVVGTLVILGTYTIIATVTNAINSDAVSFTLNCSNFF